MTTEQNDVAWVAWTQPQYPEDDGIGAIGTSQQAAVEGLRERYAKRNCHVGEIKNDTVYDYVEVFVHELNGPGYRNAAVVRYDLLAFRLHKEKE